MVVLLLAAALCFAGCTKIQDMLPESSSAVVTEEASGADTKEAVQELSAKEYEIDRAVVREKLNAEGGVYEGNVRTDGDYDGSGYIVLDKDMTLRHIFSAEHAQHYCLAIAAHSYVGASIRLKVMNETVGMYYIPASDDRDFSLFAVDSVYMVKGPSVLMFEVEEGSAAIDYIIVENTDPVASSCYHVRSSTVGSSSSISTLGAMRYLSDNYGKVILTGQCVTPGTNAETDAVYAEAGRYPAMRTGDLMYSSSAVAEKYAEEAEEEIRLAIEWGKAGGLVSMGWHWYSPAGSDSDIYSVSTGFSLKAAVGERDISMADPEELEDLYDSGFLSASAYSLIQDIDGIAEVLARFRKEDIPVIWQPLPDGDTGLYWWGGDAESYKWLWRLLFRRLDSYHGMNNLIWVWTGSSPEFYPGDDYCDIVGQSVFEKSASSFAGRFSALARVSNTDIKPLAITACDRLPSPDYMKRDNAMWLWFSIASGDCIIAADGQLSEKYTSWKSLHDAYNSRICVTRDELPDFREYALQEIR